MDDNGSTIQGQDYYESLPALLVWGRENGSEFLDLVCCEMEES